MESTITNFTTNIDLIFLKSKFFELIEEFSILLKNIQEGIIHAKKLFEQLELDYKQKIHYNFHQSLNESLHENESLHKEYENLNKSRDIVKNCENAIEEIKKCQKGIEQLKLTITIEEINSQENKNQVSKDRMDFINQQLKIIEKKYDTIDKLYNENVDKYEQIINTIK